MANFSLVYTVLQRDVASRMECSRLRPAAHFGAPFIDSVSLLSAFQSGVWIPRPRLNIAFSLCVISTESRHGGVGGGLGRHLEAPPRPQRNSSRSYYFVLFFEVT